MSHPIAAIDIGSHTIRVVAGEVRDGRIALQARASASSQGVRAGYLTNKSDATVAIKKALRITEKQMGESIQEVHVTAGGSPMSTKIVSSAVAVSHGNGHVTDIDIDNALKRSIHKSLGSNERNIEAIVLGYKLDGKETVSEPIGMHGKKLEVQAMLFNYASQNMDALEDVLDMLDVSVGHFFPAVVGSSIVSLNTIDRKVGCVLIDIGSDTTSCIVYEQDSPVHVGFLDYGSDDLTQAIALELQIPLGEAEIIKQGGPLPESVTRAKLDKIINKNCQDLFRAINNELKSIDRKANLPGGAILCGGGSLVDGIEQIAKDTLKIPARIAVVRAFRKEQDEREITWSSVYGTAINALEHERVYRRSPLSRIVRNTWHKVRAYFA